MKSKTAKAATLFLVIFLGVAIVLPQRADAGSAKNNIKNVIKAAIKMPSYRRDFTATNRINNPIRTSSRPARVAYSPTQTPGIGFRYNDNRPTLNNNKCEIKPKIRAMANASASGYAAPAIFIPPQPAVLSTSPKIKAELSAPVSPGNAMPKAQFSNPIVEKIAVKQFPSSMGGISSSTVNNVKSKPVQPVRIASLPSGHTFAPIASVPAPIGEPGSPEHSKGREALYKMIEPWTPPAITSAEAPSARAKTLVWGSGNDRLGKSFDSATVIGAGSQGLRRGELKDQIAIGNSFVDGGVRYRKVRVETLSGQQYVFAVSVGKESLGWDQARRIIPPDRFEWKNNPYGTYKDYSSGPTAIPKEVSGTAPQTKAPVEPKVSSPAQGGIRVGDNMRFSGTGLKASLTPRITTPEAIVSNNTPTNPQSGLHRMPAPLAVPEAPALNISVPDSQPVRIVAQRPALAAGVKPAALSTPPVVIKTELLSAPVIARNAIHKPAIEKVACERFPSPSPSVKISRKSPPVTLTRAQAKPVQRQLREADKIDNATSRLLELRGRISIELAAVANTKHDRDIKDLRVSEAVRKYDSYSSYIFYDTSDAFRLGVAGVLMAGIDDPGKVKALGKNDFVTINNVYVGGGRDDPRAAQYAPVKLVLPSDEAALRLVTVREILRSKVPGLSLSNAHYPLDFPVEPFYQKEGWGGITMAKYRADIEHDKFSSEMRRRQK